MVRPHGVRGDLGVKLYNPESRVLLEHDVVWLCGPEGARSVGVTHARPYREGLLMRFAGHEVRDEAEALRGQEVALPREVLPSPDPDEYYHVDLIGLRVFEDDTDVGEVEDVLAYPTVDVLCVRSSDGVREIPMIEPYLAEVDLEAGHVTVRHLNDIPLVPRRRPRKPRST